MNDTFWFFGGILSLAGIILYFFPPKNINGLYGYRTAGSMKNMESWNKSQKLGAKGLLLIGLVELGFGGFSPLVEHIFNNDTFYAFGILIIGILLTLFYTEKRIKGL